MQRNRMLWPYAEVKGMWNNEKVNITDLHNSQF